MTHTERLIVLARRRNDIAALAILEGGRRYHADPAPLRFVIKALRPVAA
jgi:hypothetical protein